MNAYIGTVVVLGALGFVVAGLIIRFYVGRRYVDQIWTPSRYSPLKDMGMVKRLTILPLIDMKPARSDLVGEAGVSYLVRADNTTILFDVGLNLRGEHPSPLLSNM